MNLLILLLKSPVYNQFGVFISGGKKVVDMRGKKPQLAECTIYLYKGSWYMGMNMMMGRGGSGFCAHKDETFTYETEREATLAGYKIILKFMQQHIESDEDERFYNRVRTAYTKYSPQSETNAEKH